MHIHTYTALHPLPPSLACNDVQVFIYVYSCILFHADVLAASGLVATPAAALIAIGANWEVEGGGVVAREGVGEGWGALEYT